MMKTTRIFLVSTLLLGASFGVATAQQAPDQPAAPELAQDADFVGHLKGRHHGGRHGGHMAMIDANSDGAIGEDEAASLADHMFNKIDQNDDGSLDEAEFSSGPRGRRTGGWFGWGQAEADAIKKVRKDKFVALDTDKSGILSKAEFFADAKARFAEADRDKDGKVSPWEFRAQN